MNTQYADFNSHNSAPPNCKFIGVYDEKGNKQGLIKIPNNMLAPTTAKRYSFGVISDLHLQYSTAETDFKKALSVCAEKGCEFVCINGDLTANGTNADLQAYKTCVEENAEIPVYAITGNHDVWDKNSEGAIESRIEAYTGKPLYYSLGIDVKGECIASDVNKTAKAYGDDVDSVFIMLGIFGEYVFFTDEEWQWLYDTLESNRNKRCFVFQHIFAGKGKTPVCGNAYGLYNNYCWDNATQTALFESLLIHYKNTIFFHGHSHLKFGFQLKDCAYANIDDSKGYRSVHIPSISVPRIDANSDGVADDNYAGSEGYIVDVYENEILLKGRDFVGNKYLPIATYRIDTTLQTIPAKTFTDSTGIITV